MDKYPYIQDISSNFFVMPKSILAELDKKMKERNIKIPALSVKLDIPASRMYKWYQQGTNPKTEDAVKVWDWINGKTGSFLAEAEQTEYKTVPALLRFIEKQHEDATRIIEKQQETIHFLTTGERQGSDPDRKKASSG